MQAAFRTAGARWATAGITVLVLAADQLSKWLVLAVTLARGCLPAVTAGGWTAPAVLAADVLDSQLARRWGEATVFGSYTDVLPDAAFWTWYAARHEPSRALRQADADGQPAPPGA